MEKGAWQQKEQDARHAEVDEGMRGLVDEKTGRVLHGLHISGNVR